MTMQRIHTTPRASRGFTLIELMIVVAVIAILGAIAYPSYQESVRKGRRGEARAALQELMHRVWGSVSSGILAPQRMELGTKTLMVRWGNSDPERARCRGLGQRKRGSCFGTSPALRVVCSFDWGPWWVPREPLNHTG